MDDLDSYISPIQRIAKDFHSRIEEREGEILMKVVHNVGFDVDKHELMRALAYDREQYKKGYADAMKNAVLLDKLCEWLQENASLKSGTLISAVGWKYALIKWMEEQDAQKEN